MFVYSGEDTYASYKTAKLHLTKLSKEKGKDIKILNEEEISSLNDLLYLTESIDIFGSSPIIFAKRIFNNKDIANYFAENIELVKNLDLIVWQDKDLDGKTKIAKTLALHKLVKSFEAPKIGELKAWIKDFSKKVGITLTEDSINFIIENVSADKWILEKEMKKLYLLDLKKPTIEQIKEIFGLTIKGDIWKFIEYVGTRDKTKAIQEVEKLSSYEDNTQLIISLLQREFRILAQLISAKNDSEKIKSIGLAPFIIKKSQAKAQNFTLFEIRELVGRLFNLDYAIKTGEIEDKIGLTLFLLTL